MPDTIPGETARPADVARRVREARALPGRRMEAWRRRLVNVVLILANALLAFLVWGAAFALQSLWGRAPLTTVTVASAAPTVAAWLGSRALLGLYPGYGLDQVEELRRQTYAVLATLAISTTTAFALQVGGSISRLALGSSLLGLLLFAPLERQLVKWWMMKARVWGKPVVILSSGQPGGRVATLLTQEWGLGYRPVAVFGGHLAPAKSRFEATPDEESLAEAMLVSQRHGVDTLIIAMPYTRRKHLVKIVDWAGLGFRHVTVIPNLGGITNSATVARNFAGVFGVEINYNLLNPSVRRAKRALDIAATVVGGVLILPLFLALCLLVWLESGGPVFYKAQRMGRDGKLFSCVKFRTMVPDAESVLQRMLEDPELRKEYLEFHKLREDPRVTRVGRILRKTSLDELPQLWNVLRGDMSLVGPRPYLPRESGEIGVAQSHILRVYPGITGPWQVSGRNRTSFGERVEIDVHYVRNWSIWLDLVILARTMKTVLLVRGAC
jgi:Undecaprenyl-phosphate galactose phosphotransferase WbaP